MDVTKFELPLGTQIKVCEESAVQYQRGWGLIAIVPWQGRVKSDEEQRDERGNYLRNVAVWRDVESVRYVLTQDPNEAIEQAMREQERAESARSEAEASLGALRLESERTNKKLLLAEAALKNTETEFRAMERKHELALMSKRAMENDIAKLRSELGDKRMREILEGK